MTVQCGLVRSEEGVARSNNGRIDIIGTAEGLVSNQVLSLVPDDDRTMGWYQEWTQPDRETGKSPETGPEADGSSTSDRRVHGRRRRPAVAGYGRGPGRK